MRSFSSSYISYIIGPMKDSPEGRAEGPEGRNRNGKGKEHPRDQGLHDGLSRAGRWGTIEKGGIPVGKFEF